MHLANPVTFITWYCYPCGVFCMAVLETLDNILSLESVKKLDSTPNDQPSVVSSYKGSESSGK